MLNWKENYEYKKKYLIESTEYRINGSCDICHKKSSFANKTCNKCFYKLMSENYEM